CTRRSSPVGAAQRASPICFESNAALSNTSRGADTLKVICLITAMIACASLPFANYSKGQTYDVVLRGGTIYDGTLAKPRTGDVAIEGDKVVAVGDIGE